MNGWLAWALFVNFLFVVISARERRPPLELPLISRVEQGWVVSVGADTSQAVTADTTHNSPPGPPGTLLAGGASGPRVVCPLPSPPGVRHFFRIG